MRFNRIFKAVVFMCIAVVLSNVRLAFSQTTNAADAQIQADVTRALNNKRFVDVKVAVQNADVTLSGTVDLYSAKEDADKKARHRKNVAGVQNLITVAGPAVEDSTLRDKLGEKLAYDRVGYGTTAFNALTIGVQNGVVTLGGWLMDLPIKIQRLALWRTIPG